MDSAPLAFQERQKHRTPARIYQLAVAALFVNAVEASVFLRPVGGDLRTGGGGLGDRHAAARAS